ncbi:hypothetical protein COO60DRAFT_1492345 [Scenedesmus sp. NREL 46B-D3]|nr:hypothetical protein COO60DRAFT_1492345 [Scenedesmus sp. NREL 46B-D3]
MQHAWQAAAAAAADLAPAGLADEAAPSAAAAAASDDELAAAWSGVVSSLTVDIAYVLSACSTASGEAGSSSATEPNAALPAGVSAVLCNLLQHLAACGMFHTMKFLVQTATGATTGKPILNSSSGAVSRRSSSGDDSGDDGGGSDPSNTAGPASRCAAVSLGRSGSTAAPSAGVGGTGGKGSSSSIDRCCEAPDGSGAAFVRAVARWEDSSSCGGSTGVDKCAANAATADTLGPMQPAAAGPACSSVCATSSGQTASVSLWQLLCGFADDVVESRFMAATFSSTAPLDLVAAAYSVAMGRQNAQAPSAAPADAARQDTCSLLMVWSVAAVLVLNAGTLLAVWLLRLTVAAAVRQRRCQQRQPAEGCGSGKVQSASGSGPAAAEAPVGASAAGATAAIDALHARAGFTRQRLLASWVVQAVVLDVLCCSGAVVTPGMMDSASVLGLGVKAWLYQVPLHWFVPLMAAEVATHAYGSYVFDLQPRYWVAVRYVPGLLLAVVVAVTAVWQLFGCCF